GVHGDDDALAAEFLGGLADELGTGDGGGVDAALVGAGEQQAAHVLRGANAAAYGQRQEDAGGGAGDGIQDRVAGLVAGGDVEEAEFVGVGCVVEGGLLDRVAGVAEGDEVHALDDAAVLYVEAGNDTQFQHSGLFINGVGVGMARTYAQKRVCKVGD